MKAKHNLYNNQINKTKNPIITVVKKFSAQESKYCLLRKMEGDGERIF
jgi:hypothetical protein